MESTFLCIVEEIKVGIGCFSKDCWKIISWVNVRSIVLYSADISSFVLSPTQLESKLKSPNKHNQGRFVIDYWSVWVLCRWSHHLKEKKMYFLYFYDTFLLLHSLCFPSFFPSLASHWIALLHFFYCHTRTYLNKWWCLWQLYLYQCSIATVKTLILYMHTR